jgi:hypothetical protein
MRQVEVQAATNFAGMYVHLRKTRRSSKLVQKLPLQKPRGAQKALQNDAKKME